MNITKEQVLSLIENEGSVGIETRALEYIIGRNNLRHLDTLRTESKIFHDLTDGRWKLIMYKEKRKQHTDTNWMAG